MNRDVCEHFNPIDLPCDRCGKVTRPDDVHTCTPKALRMNLLLESAKKALAAIENGESFRHLDEVIAPMLKKGIDSVEKPERKLTDEVIADLWYQNGTHHHHFARAVERWLRGEE